MAEPAYAWGTSGRWPWGTTWPATPEEHQSYLRRVEEAGISTEAFMHLLYRRGYKTFAEVVPERRDSVLAGILDDWRNGRGPVDRAAGEQGQAPA